MTRWLYNVNAIMYWREYGRDGAAIKWWPPPPQAQVNQPPAENGHLGLHDQAPDVVQDTAERETTRAHPNIFDDPDFRIGRFIGQGRATQYAGVSYAVMVEITPRSRPLRAFPGDYRAFADRVHKRLKGRRPVSWFVTALLSEILVMAEVMLAFMLAFNTPTVGLGCWSGSFAIYAVLSSMCWIFAVCFPKPGRVVTCLCYAFNFLAFTWLIIVTLLVVSRNSAVVVRWIEKARGN